MEVLVARCESAVPDDEFEINGTHVDERYLTHDANEWDEYALEAAVGLADTHDDVDVVTVTIGPERTEETIREGLAKGADRAVRIWDDTLAESGLLGPRAKARLLAGVATERQPTLVLTGAQSSDDAFGATGVALAERLGYGWAAVVNQLTLDREHALVRVHQELEGGLNEHTEVTLPAVVTIQTGINEPRYASLRGIRRAQQKPLAVRSSAELGVESLRRPLSLSRLAVPEGDSDVTLVEGGGDPEAAAEKLAGRLRDAGVSKGR